jgi:aspartyl-tRNA(Asn)/glutamyl-tRNA(Gln) amidotransferase subunit A
MSDPLDLGIRALGSAYAARSLSPVEMMQVLLDRIADDRDGINAFSLIDAEAAAASARASEARFRAGAALGPLDGVPVSIKDLLNVAGWPTRRGSRACDGDPPAAADAPMSASLRRAGAVIFGKTTTAEFGWAAISDCPATGITRNPRNPAHSAGGSSGGAAAQVAMGCGPLAIGSDAGGSIRIPASYCGIVGFKPTWGSVPQAPLSALGDISHPGPMTRSVDDCALALAVLAAPDPRDGASLFARTLPARPPRSLRIGWTQRFAEGAELDPAIEKAFGDRVAALRRDGYDLREIVPAGLDGIEALWPFWLSRNYESFAALLPEKRALLDPRLQRMFAEAALLDMPTLAASRTALRGVANRLAELFAEIDILLSPATPTVAPLAGEIAPRGHSGFARAVADGNWFPANPYAYPFNLTQQPAMSLPLGRDAGGLPFGLQIAGRKYHDAEVLGLARVIEEMAPR